MKGINKTPFRSTTEGHYAEETALTGAKNTYFPRIKKWIKAFGMDVDEVTIVVTRIPLS